MGELAKWDTLGRLRYKGGFLTEDRARELGVMPATPKPSVRLKYVPVVVDDNAPPSPPPAAAAAAPPAAPAAAETPASNVVPIRPGGVNVAAALEALGTRPAPAVPFLGSGGGDAPPAPAPAPPPATDLRRQEAQGFADVAAGMVTNIGVAGIAAIIRRRGREPNEPDDADVEKIQAATAIGIAQSIGDKPIPWWMTVMFGYGNLAMGMWIGAEQKRPADQLAPEQHQAGDGGSSLERPPASSAPLERPPASSAPAPRPRGAVVSGFPSPVRGA